MSYRLVAALAPLLLIPMATHSILAQQYPPDRGPYRVAVDSTMLVAMPDGVRLSMDLYKPVGAPEPLPVILWRTPYGKNRMRRAGSEPYAQRQRSCPGGLATGPLLPHGRERVALR